MSAATAWDLAIGDEFVWCGRRVRVLDRRPKYNLRRPTVKFLVDVPGVDERWLAYYGDEIVEVLTDERA